MVAINSNTVLAKDASLDNSNEEEGSDAMQLRKAEDDSVKSNIHTSKWRVFTDEGRRFFLQASIMFLPIIMLLIFGCVIVMNENRVV